MASGRLQIAPLNCTKLLHAVCATAVVDGLLPSNPCNIPKAMAAKTNGQPVILTPSEIAAIADAIEPQRLRPWCWWRRGAARGGAS